MEIHYWAMSDVPTAQAKFQKVVHPGPMAGTTVTSVSGLGDQADVKRTPSYQMNSIEFRRGVSIVSIGVNPLVSDSALIAAGKKALSRLRKRLRSQLMAGLQMQVLGRVRRYSGQDPDASVSGDTCPCPPAP